MGDRSVVPHGRGSKAGCILSGYSCVILESSDAISLRTEHLFRGRLLGNTLPDELSLVILAHFVRFRSQGKAITVQHIAPDNLFANFARYQGLPDVVPDHLLGSVQRPSSAVGVVTIERAALFCGRSCHYLFT